MRELVVHSWCDVCGGEGLRTPADSFQVTLSHPTGGTGAQELELCEPHAKELVQPLLDVLAQHGRKPQAPGSAAGAGAAKGVASPVTRPDTSSMDLPERMAATTVDMAGNRYRCPECAKLLANPASLQLHCKRLHRRPLSSYYGTDCPACGLSFGRLAQHTTRAHGHKDMLQVFLVAKAEGDPHGVVGRLERAWRART